MRHFRSGAAVVLTACATASQPAPVTVGHADSISWKATTALPTGRDHHGTFVTSRGNTAYLWVVGGNDYKKTMSDVWRAPIGASGHVGAWSEGNRLPGPRAGMGVATSDKLVVLSGGKDSAQKTVTDVFVARISSDASLGAWTPAGSLPGPRFHHATILNGKYLYVVGGLEASVAVPTVLRATLNGDGVIQKWDSLAALPRPRSHQSIFIHDGAMYLVGGLDGNPAGANTPLADVIRAKILEGGALGAWEEVSTMPHAYATHATAVSDHAVWLFGGVEDNARFVDVVLRASFSTNGTLGQWTQVIPGLPAARSHVHQVPVYRGRAYSAAGSNRRVVTGDVQIGTFLTTRAP